MVDIEAVKSKSSKVKKFSPKFDETTAQPPKKAKKSKKPFDSEDASPTKKMKVDENGGGKTGEKTDKKKKKIKVNEDVKVKEFKKVEGKKIKKSKGEGEKFVSKEFKKKEFKSKEFKNKEFKNKEFKNKENKKPLEKLNKKETREKQKKTKEVRRKFKQEDVFDIGVKAKKVWEEVRREDCPEAKKEKLITELHGLVQGNIKKIIFAHDTVRVVECLMAVGSVEIRNKLFIELKDDILEMVKSKYAHFFVQKMLRYGTKEQKAQIYTVMEGKVAKLMKNKTAGHVIENIYNDVANGPQRNCMLQEFLDQDFIHFKEPELRTVAEIVEKYPLRKGDCIQNLYRNVEVLIRKGTFNHSLVHTVLYNFLQVAEPKQRTEVIEQLREALVHMAHSREGAKAALECIWHGTAKDRKAVVKSFKTFMLKTAQEEYGHMVLLGIFDTVDDTKLVGKAVLSELLENLEELFTNKYSVRVLKYMFARRDATYINKDMITILEKGDGNEHSKKESSARHKELLDVAAPPILDFIKKGFPSNMYDASNTITLTCIINNSPPSSNLSALFCSLAKHASTPFSKGDSTPNIIENSGSSMMLRKIIAKDKEREEKSVETFSSHIVTHLEEEGVESWLRCNRGCFLLINLVDTAIPAVQESMKTKIKPYLHTLKNQDTQGAKLLLQKITN